MQTPSIRTTYKYKLRPTPEQERMLEHTLMLCRHVYNAAVEERGEAWQKCGVSVNYYEQKAELPGIKEAMPEYAEVHSQVVQAKSCRMWCCGSIAPSRRSSAG
jgi:putative transposase